MNLESSDNIQAVGKDNSDACTNWFEKEVSKMNKDACFSQERKSGWQIDHGGGTAAAVEHGVDVTRHSIIKSLEPMRRPKSRLIVKSSSLYILPSKRKVHSPEAALCSSILDQSRKEPR